MSASTGGAAGQEAQTPVQSDEADYYSPKYEQFNDWSAWTIALAEWVYKQADKGDMSAGRLACVFDMVEYQTKQLLASRSTPAAQTRTDKDYAIEHAEYLAKAAEHFLDMQNQWDMAEAAGEEYDPDARSDAWMSLRNAIGEFRKRAVRSLSATGETPPERTELTEARAMAKKVGYGSGSLASVIENLAEQNASARRALDDLVKMRNVCRNPNHAMADGFPHPHEIGPSCMAEAKPSERTLDEERAEQTEEENIEPLAIANEIKESLCRMEDCSITLESWHVQEIQDVIKRHFDR